jgi:hypothetical protein
MTRLIGNRAAIAWVVILGCACAAVALAADSSDAEHSAHAHHAMTDEQLATLRAKIPLYREYPDDAIMASMQRMKNSNALISDATVRNEVGILALAHGFGEPGNTQFKSALAPVAKVYPTAIGLGMAMMTSGHIQSAIEDLEAAGARTIIVLPTTTGEHTTLVRQWEYIFGLRNDSAYLDVPRVTANAKLVMGRTPTTDPIVALLTVPRTLETIPKSWPFSKNMRPRSNRRRSFPRCVLPPCRMTHRPRSARRMWSGYAPGSRRPTRPASGYWFCRRCSPRRVAYPGESDAIWMGSTSSSWTAG